MNHQWTSLNPPPPAKKAQDRFDREKGEGQKFLKLLKEFEHNVKVQQITSRELESTIVDILSAQRDIFLRRGLLSGNETKALEIQKRLNSFSVSDSSVNTGSAGGKKRKRGGVGGHGASAAQLGNLISMLTTNVSNLSENSAEDCFFLSNLVRILVPASSKESNTSNNIYTPSIISAAATTLSSIVQYSVSTLPSLAADVELSLIFLFSGSLLGGLSKTMTQLLDDIRCSKYASDINLALTSCCKCVTSIYCSLNIRLSRNTSISTSIKNTALSLLWDDTLSDENDYAKEAAALLLATLPLASDSDGNSPSKLWTALLQATVSDLLSILNTFFPAFRKSKVNIKSSQENSIWIQHVRDSTPSQAERLILLSKRIRSSILLISSLLRFEEYSTCNFIHVTSIPVNLFLDLLEVMLSFSSVAESRYLSTKPRLRDIAIDGGILSPNGAVTIANIVQNYGHDILQSFLAILRSSALQFGKSIIRITLSNLQSNCSSSVRKVVDPVSAVNLDKRWLHTSVHLRTRCVQSFEVLIQSLGSSAMTTHENALDKGLLLIVACLFEQLNIRQDSSVICDEHWGTLTECNLLVSTCMHTLTSSIAIMGGFMSISTRESIDSLLITYLSIIVTGPGDGVASLYTSDEKSAILDLGVQTICVPYQDGGGTLLLNEIRRVAMVLKSDRDSRVASSAYVALSICSAILTPRGPPLIIATRSMIGNDSNDRISSFSKDDLLSRMIEIKEGVKKHAESKVTTVKKDGDKASDTLELGKVAVISDSKINLMSEEHLSNVPNNSGNVVEEKTDIIKELDVEPKSSVPQNDFIEEKQDGKEMVKNENEVHSTSVVNDTRSYSGTDLRQDDSSEMHVDEENEDTDSDIDFPPIIDCGPDDDDM